MAASPAMTMLLSMVATSAIHDGDRDEKDDYTRVCHPGTREAHLESLKAWANNTPTKEHVEWVNAIAGAGKTAMLRSFCTELEEQTGLPSISFFFWQGDARRNTLKLFPSTIAAQLCRRISALGPCIEKAIDEDPFLLQSAFKKQMDRLIIRPLLDCCDAVKSERHLVIVIDGLDELNTSGQTDFLDFIPYLLSRLSSLPISLLVSSRPEAMIVGAFTRPKLASITRATRLGASDEDIWKFLNDTFEDMNLRFPYLRIKYGGKWPSDEQRAIMVRQSSGLFIWPTVALGHIDKVEKGLRHNERLEQVLSSADPKPWIASPLDNLYRAILQAHAPEDQNSVEFLQFKRRLALLCLPVNLGRFVIQFFFSPLVNTSVIPVRAVFQETLDELWGSVAGLSSVFSPRMPLSVGKSPTPGISHRSFRDFIFNQARCGDKFYYSSERDLHAEVVCKFIEFFNTRQAYKRCIEMCARFISYAGDFLQSHLKEAAVSEKLGRCMDDVMLDAIPPTWPLTTQVYLISRLFDGLYKLAENPEFPDGSQRRKAFLSKITAFLERRATSAQEWDIALFRIAISSTLFNYATSHHSVRCWHIFRLPRCMCRLAILRNHPLHIYQHGLINSAATKHASSRLVATGHHDVAHDCLDVLQFFLSLSSTSRSAVDFSPFIRSRIDYWICTLLKYCPPNKDLCNSLVPVCTAPLPDLPKREGDDSHALVKQFLMQTETFNNYAERCRAAGIETNFPPIKIPDDWWQDEKSRWELLWLKYDPPTAVPSSPRSPPRLEVDDKDTTKAGEEAFDQDPTTSDPRVAEEIEHILSPGVTPPPGQLTPAHILACPEPLQDVPTVGQIHPPTTIHGVGVENDQVGAINVAADRRRRRFREFLKRLFCG